MCRATLFYSAAFYRAARRLGAASHRRYVLASGMLVVLGAVPLTSGTAAAGAGPARSVRYLGRTFTIPRDWRVIDLAAHPHQCVRFDRHVLYLGAPGRVQDCLTGLVGATGAMLVQPSARRAVPRAVDYPVDRMITVVTRRITVTASYSSDRAVGIYIGGSDRACAQPDLTASWVRQQQARAGTSCLFMPGRRKASARSPRPPGRRPARPRTRSARPRRWASGRAARSTTTWRHIRRPGAARCCVS